MHKYTPWGWRMSAASQTLSNTCQVHGGGVRVGVGVRVRVRVRVRSEVPVHIVATFTVTPRIRCTGYG